MVFNDLNSLDLEEDDQNKLYLTWLFHTRFDELKNEENLNLLWHCWKYGRAYLTTWDISHWCEGKWGSGDFYDYLIERRSVVPFQAFQDFSHLMRFGDNCHHSHLMAAFLTDQRIDFIYLLYQPRPAPSWCLVRYRLHLGIGGIFRELLRRGCVPVFRKASIFSSLSLRSAGIQPIIPDEMFMLRWYMQCKFCYKITSLESFDIFLPVFIVFCPVYYSTILFNIKYFLQGNRMSHNILAEIYSCILAWGRYLDRVLHWKTGVLPG